MNGWQMRFRWLLFLAMLASVVGSAGAYHSLAPGHQAKVDPAFLEQVLQASPADTFRFLITVQGEADLSDIPSTRSAHERRATVVSRLQAAASAGQARLLPALEAFKKAGDVQSFQSFWIMNGAAVSGNRVAILALAARDDVRSIRPDRWLQWITPTEKVPSEELSPDLDWSISQIRADQAWAALRIDGDGVVVATMDSGVDWMHPVLQPSYRGWHGDMAIHTGNWYDATGEGAIYPVDGLGHGTHVTGLLAGQAGV